MNQNLTDLQDKIQHLRKKKKNSSSASSTRGYSIALAMMTDLISCILVGLGLGLFLQKIFHTSSLLTAIFTFLGGIAGLYTVVSFAIRQDKND